MSAERIPIIIINGSVRPGNFTSTASALEADEFRRHPEVSVEVIDPAALHLPLPGMDVNSEGTKILQEKVKNAAGIVFATPEYHGSFSSVTKLVIENLGFPSMLTGKPVALLGVAAGAIGAIKSLEHLRGVVSHVGGIVLPLPVSVANVQSVFGADGHPKDPAIEKLIRSVAVHLLEYLHNNVCPRLTLERILREGVSASVSETP